MVPLAYRHWNNHGPMEEKNTRGTFHRFNVRDVCINHQALGKVFAEDVLKTDNAF
jgi:hypothetical protein